MNIFLKLSEIDLKKAHMKSSKICGIFLVIIKILENKLIPFFQNKNKYFK